MSDRKATRKLIRQRHDSTLLIDWQREFAPDAQPLSHANAKMCHADRGTLLDDCDVMETEIKELQELLATGRDLMAETHAEVNRLTEALSNEKSRKTR